MLTFLLTCFFCLSAGLCLWFLSRARTDRARQLQDFALNHRWRYSPRQPFSRELRFRQFRSLACAASASGRHWIDQDDSLSVFDCSTLTRNGVEETTVLLLHCPVALEGRLCISRRPWLNEDSFTPTYGDRLQHLTDKDIPRRLAGWCCFSDSRHRMRRWFLPDVIDWLLNHPGLHVEWSDGWLLVCQPGYRIQADELDRAIEDVFLLSGHLQSSHHDNGEYDEQAQ